MKLAHYGDPWSHGSLNDVLFLMHASSKLEQTLLRDWINETRPAEASRFTAEKITFLSSGKRYQPPLHTDLVKSLEASDETIVVPLHVAWRLAPHNKPRLRDFLLGDPRDPRQWRARRLLRKHPERVALVAAEAASIGDLKRRHRLREGDGAAQDSFADFVARQSMLALERAERGISGMRHKLPRFVSQTLMARQDFRDAVQKAGESAGLEVSRAFKDAATYLKEVVAVPTSFCVDLISRFYHFFYTTAYDENVLYDPADLERVRELAKRYPVALLFTHKSYIDSMPLMYVLHQQGFPLVHTFGGINMGFWGVGSFFRRAGIIFIRRSFQNNPVYKVVLRQYIGYLMEKHFPLAWAFEGTRSRTGKLMPPRLGLLKYTVEAAAHAQCGKFHLIPVSVVYDLIPDVAEYAAEQGGGVKKAESLIWLFRYLSGMKKPHGRISLKFGEAVVVDEDLLHDDLSVSDSESKPSLPRAEEDQFSIELNKLAFEVCVNANKVTPITSLSLIAVVLLGAVPRAMTQAEIGIEVTELILWARRRNIPMTADFQVDVTERMLALADAMIKEGIISRYDEGPESVYMIAPHQDLIVSYYRNTGIHFFVMNAIIELALLKAAEFPAGKSEAAFWREALALRDNLKFEFFYPPSDQFIQGIGVELDLQDSEWRARLDGGGSKIAEILSRIRPLFAHATLRPFAEAYRVAGDLLLQFGSEKAPEEKIFTASCLKFGKQAFLQRRISSEESLARILFSNAYKLAENLKLLDQDDGQLHSRRVAFARALHDINYRIQTVQSMSATRHGFGELELRSVEDSTQKSLKHARA